MTGKSSRRPGKSGDLAVPRLQSQSRRYRSRVVGPVWGAPREQFEAFDKLILARGVHPCAPPFSRAKLRVAMGRAKKAERGNL